MQTSASGFTKQASVATVAGNSEIFFGDLVFFLEISGEIASPDSVADIFSRFLFGGIVFFCKYNLRNVMGSLTAAARDESTV